MSILRMCNHHSQLVLRRRQLIIVRFCDRQLQTTQQVSNITLVMPRDTYDSCQYYVPGSETLEYFHPVLFGGAYVFLTQHPLERPSQDRVAHTFDHAFGVRLRYHAHLGCYYVSLGRHHCLLTYETTQTYLY